MQAAAAGAAMADAVARAEAASPAPRTSAAAPAADGELAAERERNRMLTQRLGESQTALSDLRSQLAEAKRAAQSNGVHGKVCQPLSFTCRAFADQR